VVEPGNIVAQQCVDFVSLLQNLVQIVLADDIPQAGQSQLIDRRR
jgi:hypothetical protein